MEKRLHDKKAGIAILAALIIISLLDFVFRHGCLREVVLSTANFGEPLATIILAAILLFFTAKGKDRICFICYVVWIGYFILDQIIEMPGQLLMLPELITRAAAGMHTVAFITWSLRGLSMFAIIGIGVLLVEYMNDGTIYNNVFNILCIVTVLMLSLNTVLSIWTAVNIRKELMLDAFNCMYRIIMVFLSAFFAYDSAKMQLKKFKFTK